MAKISPKKYVVIYQSQEHYEVLGYVIAPNIEEAINRTREELKKEAEFYDVAEAEIGELKEQKKITFDVEQEQK